MWPHEPQTTSHTTVLLKLKTIYRLGSVLWPNMCRECFNSRIIVYTPSSRNPSLPQLHLYTDCIVCNYKDSKKTHENSRRRHYRRGITLLWTALCGDGKGRGWATCFVLVTELKGCCGLHALLALPSTKHISLSFKIIHLTAQTLPALFYSNS